MFLRLHQDILPENKDVYQAALNQINVSIKTQKLKVNLPKFDYSRQLNSSKLILFDSERNIFYSLSFNQLKKAPFPAPFKVKKLNLTLTGKIVVFDVMNEDMFFYAEIIDNDSLRVVEYDLQSASSSSRIIENCFPSVLTSTMKRGALINDSLYIFSSSTVRIALSSGLCFELDDLNLVPTGAGVFNKFVISPLSAPNSVFELDRFHVLTSKFFLPAPMSEPTAFMNGDSLVLYDKNYLIECNLNTKLTKKIILPDEDIEKLLFFVDNFVFSLKKSNFSFLLQIYDSPRISTQFLPKNLYLPRSILPSKAEAFVLLCQGFLDSSKIDFTLDDFVKNECAYQLSGKWQYPVLDRDSLLNFLQ